MKYSILAFLTLLLLLPLYHSASAETLSGNASAIGTTTAQATIKNNTNDDIEALVRAFFSNVPVMIDIAKCESGFRQFNSDGTVLKGGGSSGMVGIFQFYEAIHGPAALVLGFDINTVEGNIGYAKYVYDQSGTRPWASCVPATVTVDTNRELQIKLLTKLVDLLTELLKLQLAQR